MEKGLYYVVNQGEVREVEFKDGVQYIINYELKSTRKVDGEYVYVRNVNHFMTTKKQADFFAREAQSGATVDVRRVYPQVKTFTNAEGEEVTYTAYNVPSNGLGIHFSKSNMLKAKENREALVAAQN